jgi:putative oxidoreductase
MNQDAPLDWRYFFRLALGAVFLWAGLAKIADPAGFAREIHNFHLMPVAFENIFAIVLPWVELVSGLALVTNAAPRSASLVLGSLLVVFFFAILSAIIRNLDIACGCFGTSDASKTGWVTLLRDAAFLALGLIGWPRRGAARHRTVPEPEAA